MWVLILVCWFAVFGAPASVPHTSTEVWREALPSRFIRQAVDNHAHEEDHHGESGGVTDGTTVRRGVLRLC